MLCTTYRKGLIVFFTWWIKCIFQSILMYLLSWYLSGNMQFSKKRSLHSWMEADNQVSLLIHMTVWASWEFDSGVWLVLNRSAKPYIIAKRFHMLKGHFSSENYPQKCRLIKFVSETNLMDWQKSLKIDDYYINEVGIYDLLVSSQ